MSVGMYTVFLSGPAVLSVAATGAGPLATIDSAGGALATGALARAAAKRSGA